MTLTQRRQGVPRGGDAARVRRGRLIGLGASERKGQGLGLWAGLQRLLPFAPATPRSALRRSAVIDALPRANVRDAAVTFAGGSAQKSNSRTPTGRRGAGLFMPSRPGLHWTADTRETTPAGLRWLLVEELLSPAASWTLQATSSFEFSSAAESVLQSVSVALIGCNDCASQRQNCCAWQTKADQVDLCTLLREGGRCGRQ